MEADEYFSTYDALQDQQKKEQSVRRQLPLKTNENCGINKIVWSQFDFMTGPELKFVWEVTPSTSISPVNLSGEDGSVADAESLIDSSGSTKSVSFEDIDDPLKTELTILEGLDEQNALECSSESYRYKTLKYLDEYMMESRTTSSSKTLTMDDSRIMESPGSSGKSLKDEGVDHVCDDDYLPVPESNSSMLSHEITKLSPSPNDTGLLAKLMAEKYPSEEDQELVQLLKEKLKRNEQQLTECVAHLSEHYELDRLSPITPSDELRRSCVDSGVGVSTHSDLSTYCHTPTKQQNISENDFGLFTSTPNTSRRDGSPSNSSLPPQPKDIFDFFEDQVDYGESCLSDESFVVKTVLAELICNVPHARSPLQHKLIVSPVRHLIVSAFIFSAQLRSGSPITYAISFLMSDERQSWYMDRQTWFEEMIRDSVPKMKASLFSEDADDVLVRITSELTKLLSLLSSLERHALISTERPLMIKNTLFAENNLVNNAILSKSISGCLQSQGNVVVIGSDHVLVARMVHTLAFFVPINYRWCCLRPYRHKYNPYLKIQAIRRSELSNVINGGARSMWPICIIDLDRSTVCMSAPYQRHRILKARNDSRGVRLILEHAGVMSSSKKSKSLRLELKPCGTIECVGEFLKHMELLPLEESARSGFCDQLMLYFDNLATAFIYYVQDSSRPTDGEKECGTKSRNFSLTDCRKALDLVQDAFYNAVLARAELLKPDIAEFIYM